MFRLKAKLVVAKTNSERRKCNVQIVGSEIVVAN